MTFWKQYKSPLGYYNNDDQIDSYGVNHSDFSTRDELNYQIARQERENKIKEQLQNQGIDTLPQYGTNFWNKSADNNYGFGKSNIEIPTDTPQETYTTESAWGYPNNRQSPFYNKMGRPYNIQQNPYKLGTLSGLQESNNGQELWNDCDADKTGGCSYGTYQIETKRGTMKDYLKYLQKHQDYQDFYHKLQQAGGYNTALAGDAQFKNAWADLSKDADFLQSQHNFIIDEKLNRALNKIQDIKGLDLDNRSPVIKDVLHSTATQHGQGGAPKILHNALGYDASNLSDEDIINKIYDERSNTDGYFTNSSPEYKQNIKTDRFPKERLKALELLRQYPR